MSEIKSVCVYCGSSPGKDVVYEQTAKRCGALLAENGMRLVYGGGHVGLMGMTADAALEGGAEVIGIIPEHIQKREVKHHGLSELHVVDSMHTRKQMMVDKSDAFVVLPGGFGTMDETFEIITWKQLGLHDKPIIIANIADYWTSFVKMAEHIVGQGFAGEDDMKLFTVIEDIENLVPVLKASPDEEKPPDIEKM